jgi:hypothetical protein
MKNAPISYEIAPNLFLVQQPVVTTTRNTIAESPTNHLLVIDCSGSMYGELPLIRKQLKNKLPKLLKEDDTISIVWFSGKGEFGTLCEGEKVNGLSELKSVNDMIDRWLKPVGLTGFKEPLLLVTKVITSVKNSNPWSLFFMSDGCDNQWDRGSILKAVETAAGKLSAATFVEYGYYADRQLLAAMAEKAGGTHIFAESFPKFEPVLDASLAKRVMGGKRVEVKIGGDPIGGFAFALADGDLQTFEVAAGKVAVPETIGADVWYLSPSQVGTKPWGLWTASPGGSQAPGSAISALYGALALFAVRMKPDVVFPLLKATGDVAFIKSFSTCFGKQKYSTFMQEAQRAAFDPSHRLTQGYNPNLVPPDDAFTVLDFLNLLTEDDEARVLLDHPAFEYNKIGRGRLDADEYLTIEEQEKLEALQGEQKATRNAKKLKEIQAEIDELLAKKRTALKFTATPAPNGYEVAALTFNETKPNVSILVCKEGTVNLTERIGETKDGKLAGIPFHFPTKIWRNYAIIKDGLVNVGKLPVKISGQTAQKLIQAGVTLYGIDEVRFSSGGSAPYVYTKVPSNHPCYAIVDLLALPVLNRKTVQASQSAAKLVELQYKLTQAKAAQKVYNAVQKAEAPVDRGALIAAKYGDYCAAWLQEQGLTDGGFQPKSTQAESKDFYIAREMDVKLKGLASLPKVDDVRAKLASKTPPTGGAALMAPFVKEVDDFMKSNPAKLHKDFIQGKAKMQRAIARGLIFQKSQIVFSTIVGQTWFTEFKSLDENTLDITIDGKTVTGTIELREVEVKI